MAPLPRPHCHGPRPIAVSPRSIAVVSSYPPTNVHPLHLPTAQPKKKKKKAAEQTAGPASERPSAQSLSSSSREVLDAREPSVSTRITINTTLLTPSAMSSAAPSSPMQLPRPAGAQNCTTTQSASRVIVHPLPARSPNLHPRAPHKAPPSFRRRPARTPDCVAVLHGEVGIHMQWLTDALDWGASRVSAYWVRKRPSRVRYLGRASLWEDGPCIRRPPKERDPRLEVQHNASSRASVRYASVGTIRFYSSWQRFSYTRRT